MNKVCGHLHSLHVGFKKCGIVVYEMRECVTCGYQWLIFSRLDK